MLRRSGGLASLALLASPSRGDGHAPAALAALRAALREDANVAYVLATDGGASLADSLADAVDLWVETPPSLVTGGGSGGSGGCGGAAGATAAAAAAGSASVAEVAAAAAAAAGRAAAACAACASLLEWRPSSRRLDAQQAEWLRYVCALGVVSQLSVAFRRYSRAPRAAVALVAALPAAGGARRAPAQAAAQASAAAAAAAVDAALSALVLVKAVGGFAHAAGAARTAPSLTHTALAGATAAGAGGDDPEGGAASLAAAAAARRPRGLRGAR